MQSSDKCDICGKDRICVNNISVNGKLIWICRECWERDRERYEWLNMNTVNR